MAFDEALATRVRKIVAKRAGLEEKKMFGGVGFLVNGNMAVGLHGNELIVRLDPDAGEQALEDPDVRRFDITGRPMKGWILIAPGGTKTDAALKRWIDVGVAFAKSLPAKT